MADLKTRWIQLLDLAQSFRQQLLADFSSDEDKRSGAGEQWSLKVDWPEQYGIARYNLACFYALGG